MADILSIVVGVIALTLGRKLFWFFVGAIGFAIGIYLATQFLQVQPAWAALAIALAAGLLGALLATFVQQLAISIAGFIGGGYITISLLNVVGWETGAFPWLPFIIGGIIGLVLVWIIFDWALIVLSSLVGAGLIVDVTHLTPRITVLLFVVLFVVGIAIQAGLMRWRKRPKRDEEDED